MAKRDSRIVLVTRKRVASPPIGGRLSLLIIGDNVVFSHPLPDASEVTLGRSDTCDVRIDDESLSRKHALLRLDASMTIEDLGSANGTRVRSERLAPHSAAVIACGEAVELGGVTVIVQQRMAQLRSRRMWAHDYFEGRLEEECARAERTADSFCVVRAHVDAGVPTGVVLSAFADTLRAADVVGSYGPGEYEVLLVESTRAQAEPIVQRLTAQLSRHGANLRIGLACYPHDGRNPDVLLARASGATRAETSEAPVAAIATMRNLHHLVERIAGSAISVLILGETGVGKEIVAETIHGRSPRSGKPFLRLNCAALSESLLESELFGHERGAFTGAVQTKPGLLETANGGTVFLDEIGELPRSTQAKLLRVLEERKVLRVGGVVPRKIDVRFVAATNRDLEAEFEQGWFRRDLYYRLSGVTLVIPPLRERVSEIESLARSFVADACKRERRQVEPALAADAVRRLEQYSWPGNIRELRNVIERAVLLCGDGSITSEHLPVEKMRATYAVHDLTHKRPMSSVDAAVTGDPVSRLETPAPVGDESLLARTRRAKQELERRQILEALRRCAGNQSQAAKLLGISRRTLVSRLSEYGIPRPRASSPGVRKPD